MKKLSVILASIVLVFGMSIAAFAQDSESASHNVTITIPTIALVDLEGDDEIVIALTPEYNGSEAGAPLDFTKAENSSIWLNYTSVVAPEQTRNITVSMDKELPTGLSLELGASPSAAANKGKGTFGTGTTVTLSTTATDLITGIGSAYTGNGTESGHQLTYTLKKNDDNYETLVAKEYVLTVTYTISE